MTREQIEAMCVLIKSESHPIVHDLVQKLCDCLADVAEAKEHWATDNTQWSRRAEDGPYWQQRKAQLLAEIDGKSRRADDLPANVHRIGVSR